MSVVDSTNETWSVLLLGAQEGAHLNLAGQAQTFYIALCLNVQTKQKREKHEGRTQCAAFVDSFFFSFSLCFLALADAKGLGATKGPEEL